MGKYPMLDEKTSLDVLKSSVEAYNFGQGEWPTMSVCGEIRIEIRMNLSFYYYLSS
jgi:hypothetical protein